MGRIIGQEAALQIYTQEVMNAIQERRAPSQGFKAWFPDHESDAKEFTIEKQLFGRPIAYDVNYNDKATMYRRDKSTQDVYVPPFFNLGTPMDAMQGFYRVFGQKPHVDTVDLNALIKDVSINMLDNVDRIERAEELQRAQALESGIVTLINGDNINFRRDAATLTPYNAAHDWTIQTVNPGKILAEKARFLVNSGNLNQANAVDVFVGYEAWDAFRGNDLRQKEGDIKDQRFMSMTAPEGMPEGLIFYGSYSYGSFKFNMWGYEGVYDDTKNSLTNVNYLNPKKVILSTPGIKHLMWYGATPGWSGSAETGYPIPVKGKRYYDEFRDREQRQMKFTVQSAPVATLVYTNDVATVQVVPS